VRISVDAQLDSIRQAISMDIGFGDIVIPSPVDLDYPVLLSGFPATHIVAYSLETVVAEKFQTMVVRSTLNSRMKDFFDSIIPKHYRSIKWFGKSQTGCYLTGRN
jgi:hypothetical protein